MKKRIAYFVAGAVIFGAAGVMAGQYAATENPFPVQLNGSNISLEGYNINGSTYFKLRDIADMIGGFAVDFNNNTIQLSKDGYVYESPAAPVKKPFVDKFSIEAAQVPNSYYDLDGNGINDEFSISTGSGYSEAIGDYAASYNFIINGQTYHISDMRHGTYQRVYIADIDQTDNYLDIVLLGVYKGAWAEIYRYDGNGIIPLKNEQGENYFNASDNGEIYDHIDDITVNVLDSVSQRTCIQFVSGGAIPYELHQYFKTGDVYIELEPEG